MKKLLVYLLALCTLGTTAACSPGGAKNSPSATGLEPQT